jgi:hypothetical protein
MLRWGPKVCHPLLAPIGADWGASATPLLPQRGRGQVADAERAKPAPGGLTPSGCVVSYVCSLTKPADQGSVYTHIAHWARSHGGSGSRHGGAMCG